MDTTVLFKYRSVTACMKASYDLMNHHLTSLLKKTWWAMLIYAIFVAFTLYFRLPNKALHDWGEASPWSSYIIQTFIYLGVWVTGIVSCAAIWVWLKKMFSKAKGESYPKVSGEKMFEKKVTDEKVSEEKESEEKESEEKVPDEKVSEVNKLNATNENKSKISFKKTLIRFALISILFDFILGLVVGGFTGGVSSFYQGYAAHAAADNPMIQVGAAADSTAQMGMAADSIGAAHQAIANGTAATDGTSWMTNGAIGCILGIVFIALMLLVCIPFANIIPQVMLKGQGEKWELWKSYKMGLRHFGGIFKMAFLGGIILSIILFVVSIPAMILCWSQVTSQLGALNGDPLGVPSYFPIQTFIVFTLTIFALSYAFTWLNISFVYFFGANKALEEKKLEAK